MTKTTMQKRYEKEKASYAPISIDNRIKINKVIAKNLDEKIANAVNNQLSAYGVLTKRLTFLESEMNKSDYEILREIAERMQNNDIVE